MNSTVFNMLLISGLVLGCIYGLIALGYSLIYKASGLMSFVQGDVMTLGAYLGITFFSILKLPFAISLILTMVIAFGFGMLLEKGVIRQLLNKNVSQIYIVLATIAISYIIQNGVQLGWGTIMLPFPPIFEGLLTIRIFGVNVQPEALLCVGTSFIFMIILHFFMSKTSIGTSMRAAAMDGIAAEACGIDVSLSTGITWGLSAGLAALAGILIGPIYGVYSMLGATIGRKGFSSAVIGGYGNMYGAMVGGVLLGVVETFASNFNSTYKNLYAYLILIIFLFIKPTGLFNERALQDV